MCSDGLYEFEKIKIFSHPEYYIEYFFRGLEMTNREFLNTLYKDSFKFANMIFDENENALVMNCDVSFDPYMPDEIYLNFQEHVGNDLTKSVLNFFNLDLSFMLSMKTKLKDVVFSIKKSEYEKDALVCFRILSFVEIYIHKFKNLREDIPQQEEPNDDKCEETPEERNEIARASWHQIQQELADEQQSLYELMKEDDNISHTGLSNILERLELQSTRGGNDCSFKIKIHKQQPIPQSKQIESLIPETRRDLVLLNDQTIEAMETSSYSSKNTSVDQEMREIPTQTNDERPSTSKTQINKEMPSTSETQTNKEMPSTSKTQTNKEMPTQTNDEIPSTSKTQINKEMPSTSKTQTNDEDELSDYDDDEDEPLPMYDVEIKSRKKTSPDPDPEEIPIQLPPNIKTCSKKIKIPTDPHTELPRKIKACSRKKSVTTDTEPEEVDLPPEPEEMDDLPPIQLPPNIRPCSRKRKSPEPEEVDLPKKIKQSDILENFNEFDVDIDMMADSESIISSNAEKMLLASDDDEDL